MLGSFILVLRFELIEVLTVSVQIAKSRVKVRQIKAKMVASVSKFMVT